MEVTPQFTQLSNPPVQVKPPSTFDPGRVTIICRGNFPLMAAGNLVNGLKWAKGKAKLFLMDYDREVVRAWLLLRYGDAPWAPVSAERLERLVQLAHHAGDTRTVEFLTTARSTQRDDPLGKVKMVHARLQHLLEVGKVSRRWWLVTTELIKDIERQNQSLAAFCRLFLAMFREKREGLTRIVPDVQKATIPNEILHLYGEWFVQSYSRERFRKANTDAIGQVLNFLFEQDLSSELKVLVAGCVWGRKLPLADGKERALEIWTALKDKSVEARSWLVVTRQDKQRRGIRKKLEKIIGNSQVSSRVRCWAKYQLGQCHHKGIDGEENVDFAIEHLWKATAECDAATLLLAGLLKDREVKGRKASEHEVLYLVNRLRNSDSASVLRKCCGILRRYKSDKARTLAKECKARADTITAKRGQWYIKSI